MRSRLLVAVCLGVGVVAACAVVLNCAGPRRADHPFEAPPEQPGRQTRPVPADRSLEAEE